MLQESHKRNLKKNPQRRASFAIKDYFKGTSHLKSLSISLIDN